MDRGADGPDDCFSDFEVLPREEEPSVQHSFEDIQFKFQFMNLSQPNEVSYEQAEPLLKCMKDRNDEVLGTVQKLNAGLASFLEVYKSSVQDVVEKLQEVRDENRRLQLETSTLTCESVHGNRLSEQDQTAELSRYKNLADDNERKFKNTNKALQDLIRQHKMLTAEYKKLRSELEAKVVQINDLNNRVPPGRTDVATSTDQDMFGQELSRYKGLALQHERQLNQVLQDMKQLSEKYTSLEDEREMLFAELKKKEEENTILRSLTNDKSNHSAILGEIEAYKNKLREAENEIAGCRQELYRAACIRSEHERQIARQGVRERELLEFKEECIKLQSALDDKTRELQSLKRHLQDKEDASLDREQFIDDVLEKNTQLERNLESKEGEIEELRKMFQEKAELVIEKDRSMQDLKRSNIKLTEAVQNSKLEINNLKKTLQERVSEAENNKKRYDEIVSQHTARSRNYEQELERIKKEIGIKTTEASRLGRLLTEVRADFESSLLELEVLPHLRQQVAVFEEDLNKEREQQNHMRSTISNLQKEIDALHRANQVLIQEINDQRSVYRQ